jgi:hypothetical protein
MKTKQKYNTDGTVLKFNRKIIKRGKIDSINTQIHDRSLFWPSTDTSIKSGGVMLYFCDQNYVPI